MDLRRVATVMPCDSLGDFPVELVDEDAALALHYWTAPWHPALLAATGRVPAVLSSFSPIEAEDAEGWLLLIPQLSFTSELEEWIASIKEAQPDSCVIIDSLADRDSIISAVSESGIAMPPDSHRWAPEFYALGYAFLQTELLTHSLLYSSLVSPDDLEGAIVKAAKAACTGADQQVNDSLRLAYDMLEQVRDHSYPVETNLLDLVLLGSTTLGDRLDRELQEASPKSVLIAPSIAKRLEQSRPEAAAELAQQDVIVAFDRGESLSTLSPMALRRAVHGAVEGVRRFLGDESPVIAHTEDDIPSRLAAEVDAVDAEALLIAPTNGRAAVACDESRFQWQSDVVANVETLCSTPSDATSPGTVLRHGRQLSETLYREHISTRVFAAWAGCRHELFDDLRRVARRSNVLGKFQTVTEYFRETTGVAPEGEVDQSLLGLRSEPRDTALAPCYRPEYAETLDCIARASGQLTGAAAEAANPAESAARRVAQSIGGTEGHGQLVVNGWSYARPVVLSDPDAHNLCDLLDAPFVPKAPGLGYSVIANTTPSPQDDAPPRALGNEIQSELLHGLIDETTGGLRSLRRQTKRRNRLSQRLAVRRGKRLIDLPVEFELSEPIVLANSSDRGALQVRGTLRDLKRGDLAQFVQTFVLFANWDRLFVDIEIDTRQATTKLDELRFVSRVAFPDSDYRFKRGNQWTRLADHGRSFYATDYVQAASDQESLTLCGAGVRHYLRHGPRMLDYLLPEAVDGVIRSRMIVALDESRPLRAALDLAAQQMPCAQSPCAAPPGGSGWIAHVDASSVQLSLFDSPSGRDGGLRIVAVETHGRAVNARLRLARRPTAAWRIDSHGRRAETLEILDDTVSLPLDAHQMLAIEVTW